MSASWDGRVRMLDADGKPGRYYVTARDARGRTAFLLGPFTQPQPGQNAHARALGLVAAARRAVHRRDFREAPWLTYGTARLELYGPAPRAVLTMGDL